MILSDHSIRDELGKGTIKVEPFDVKNIQPSSIDVHLAKKFLVFDNSTIPLIDVRKDNSAINKPVEIEDDKPFILHPGEFVLGSTVEKISLPNNIAGRIEGKSSLGRLGLLIHSTAGYIDPGFSGRITLELSNVSKLPIALYAGMKIGQISFSLMTTPVDRPYGHKDLGSKYQNQENPEASQFHKNF